MHLAGREGLPTLPLRLEWLPAGSSPLPLSCQPEGQPFSLLVAGDRIVGECSPELAARCLAFARAAACELLLLHFVTSAGNPLQCILTGADPMPALAGEPALGAVVALLEARAGGAQ
jgi:hypothetical protein